MYCRDTHNKCSINTDKVIQHPSPYQLAISEGKRSSARGSLTLQTLQCSPAKNEDQTQWLFCTTHLCGTFLTTVHLLQAAFPQVLHPPHSPAASPELQLSPDPADLHHFIRFPANSSSWPALSPFSTWLPLSHSSRIGSSCTSFRKTGWTFLLLLSPLCVHVCTHTLTHAHRWSCSHLPGHSATPASGKLYCNVPCTTFVSHQIKNSIGKGLGFKRVSSTVQSTMITLSECPTGSVHVMSPLEKSNGISADLMSQV